MGQARMYGAIFITMFLGGLWHGAAWNFILWGIYQAVLLMIYRLFNIDSQTEGYDIKRIFQTILFFHLTVLGWLLFRAQSIHQITQMLHALFFNFNYYDQNILLWLQFCAFTIPLLLIQCWQFKANDLMVLYKQHWLLKAALYAFLTYLLVGWGVLKSEEFIYFQF